MRWRFPDLRWSQSMFGVPCTVLGLPILAHSTLHHLALRSLSPTHLLSTQESVFGKQIFHFPEVKNKNAHLVESYIILYQR